MNNKYYAELITLTPASAIFIRGFMDCYREGERSLLKCQTAGLDRLRSHGSDMAVTTISKRSRLMRDAGVMSARRVKGKFMLTDGDTLDEFLEFLDTDAEYGTRLTGSAEQDDQRAIALGHMQEHGSIRSTEDSRIPSAAYKVLMQKVKAGELDLVFVESGLKGGFKKDGTTKLCKPADFDQA